MTFTAPRGKFMMVAAGSIFLALAMVASAWLLSRFMVKIQRETTISAKGYAEKLVTADLGSFSAALTVQSTDLAAGYKTISTQCAEVTKMLAEFGFKPEEINVDGVVFNRVFRYVNGEETGELLYFNLSQTIRICTKDVKRISDNYRKLNTLLANGIQINVAVPEYFISNPEAYKLALTAEASKSAAARAEIMAKEGGAELKELLSARLGVIQINRPASSEMSDYGVYDTSSPEKVIKIVVALEFSTR
ncbi:MAG: SIMPL domain-containing protein [Victivallaceae bacterium]|nr:SIMPL domain-containing protein [Victivallaceae bacterium]